MAFPSDPGAAAIMQNQAEELGMGRYASNDAASNTTSTDSSTSQAILDLDKRPIQTPIITSFEKTKKGNSITLGSAFLKRYYSVIDAEIYFGNHFVEDINTINWTINQNVRPLFGYNSYTLDEVARGSRIVQGSFAINFISPNYLFDLLEVAQGESITNLKSYVVEQPSIKAGDVQGKINKSLRGIKQGNNTSPIWPQTFDIDVIFGQKTGIGNPVHVLLEGVAIMNCATGLSGYASSGPPAVQEMYSFLAKDIKTIA